MRMAELRVARAVTAVATLWFALAATWEIGGPLLAGHYAASASEGIIADNMLRWKIAGPVWQYVMTRPLPSAYYCHHPWGIFWTTAALAAVLGHHDFVCRLAPVLLSVATPPLLYALGSALWRPAAGAVAAAAFVVLPIALSFAQFNALEVPVMAWSLLGAWGYVRLAQTGRRPFLLASAAGLFMALHADWPALLLTSALLGFVLVRATVLRRFFGAIEHARSVRAWWWTTAVLVVSTVALYAWLFARSGKTHDLFASYDQRAAPVRGVSALEAIFARRSWLELSFTEIGLALGVIGALALAVRLVVLRREHEAVPLAFLFMATVQYVVFRSGADVHVFWPQYFAASFALGMGALVATATSALERRGVARPALVALGVALVPLLVMLRDSVPVLRYARATGGRFEEKGNLIDSQGDAMSVLRWLDERLPPEATVALGRSLSPNWSQAWALAWRSVTLNEVPPSAEAHGNSSVWVGDSRMMPDAMQADLAAHFHVVAAGPLWLVTPAEPAAPIDAFAIDEREPTWWQWYFVSGTEPVRSLSPDPFLTWELRVHFGQPAERPRDTPGTLEQKRIAYDMALDAGDAARAAALLQELSVAIAPLAPAGTSTPRLDDRTEVLGTTRAEGVLPSVTVWLRAGQTADPPDVQLAVWSQVESRAPFSTIMADPFVREVGQPMAIAPSRWKAGWLYADRVLIRKRPGTERFWIESGVRARKAKPGDGIRVTLARM
jgi:4-amino-4-deoxy-L-arabinose transferase-like glycosyltransferase